MTAGTSRFKVGLFAVAVMFVASQATIRYAMAVPNEVKITELAPGVYFRKAQTEPKFTGCNQGWVVFKDYVLVIDANFPGQAEEVIKVIRKYTDKPIRFAFDTHYHGDHADGNQQYEKIGATVVAHERSQPLFQTKGIDAFMQAKKDAERKDEYGPLAYAMPSLYFSHKLIFDDGNQRVELLFLGHAHTAGDAVAWLPRHGILFTGDACVNGAFNYTGDSNTESWISVLTAMEELQPKQVAPGHGELAGKELIAMQRRYFVELRNAVRKSIDGGQKLDQIKETLDLPFYKEWAGVEAKTRVENIEHVYQELTAEKKPLQDTKQFGRWQKLPGSGQYAQLGTWDEIGHCEADERWTRMADLYLKVDSQRRKQIREFFMSREGDLADMCQYVRRLAMRIETANDVTWLRRGLAVAAIEGGRRHYGDTAVALALLRHASERAGIDADSLFGQIQHTEFIPPENKLLFENIRTQADADVAAIARDFGPTSWLNPAKRQ